MLNLPAPPSPQLGWLLDLSWALGALAMGAALILWGRHLHRLVVTAATAGLAVLVAVPINKSMPGVDSILIVGTLVVTFALAGLIIAKVGWAFTAGALAGLILLSVLVPRYQPAGRQEPAKFAPADKTFPAWVRAAQDAAGDAVARTLWAKKDAYWTIWPLAQVPWTASAWKIQLYVGAPAFVVFLLALFWSRLATFLMCSLVGACSLVAAFAFLADWLWPSFWPGAWNQPLWPLAVILALTLLGLFLQYRAALAADRRHAAETKPRTRPQTPVA